MAVAYKTSTSRVAARNIGKLQKRCVVATRFLRWRRSKTNGADASSGNSPGKTVKFPDSRRCYLAHVEAALAHDRGRCPQVVPNLPGSFEHKNSRRIHEALLVFVHREIMCTGDVDSHRVNLGLQECCSARRCTGQSTPSIVECAFVDFGVVRRVCYSRNFAT